MASPNNLSAKGYIGKDYSQAIMSWGLICIDWYLCLWRFVSVRELNGDIDLTDIAYSVCIISVIRLIVLSRLEAFDVTCQSRSLPISIRLNGSNRELCECRNLVGG